MFRKYMKRVGFWKSYDEPDLPMPEPEQKLRIPDKGKFYKNLFFIQQQKASVDLYKGYSLCRICGERNGSREYRYRGFIWPEGYIHYIKDHNVRPDEEFRKMVVEENGHRK